jgi:hypothetical protein
MHKILKRPTTNVLGFVNVISLKSNKRHVTATSVAIFRVVETRTIMKSGFVEIASRLKITQFLV